MKREDVKVGQRVVSYHTIRRIGVVDSIHGSEGTAFVECGSNIYEVHTAQLRLLKKKPRERRWTMEEIRQAWDNCPCRHDSFLMLRDPLLALPERGKK